MLIKVKSHKTPYFKRLLSYMFDTDKHQLYDPRGNSLLITHNIKGNSIEEFDRQLKLNESRRKQKRKGQVYSYHEILSWRNEDTKNITVDKLEDIAREYIQRKNPKAIWIFTAHWEKKNVHLHALSSGAEYRTGKSSRISKEEFGQLKKDIQIYQLQQYPEISHSAVKHGKKDITKSTEKEFQFKLRTKQKSDREQVAEVLQSCYKQSKSKDDFAKRLTENGLETYMRGKTLGIIYNKRKYRLNKLGFSAELLRELDKAINRSRELGNVRNRKNKGISRNL